MFSAGVLLIPLNTINAATIKKNVSYNPASDGTPLKKVLAAGDAGENLLDQSAWRPWQKGFEIKDDVFKCDNATDAQVQRGI